VLFTSTAGGAALKRNGIAAWRGGTSCTPPESSPPPLEEEEERREAAGAAAGINDAGLQTSHSGHKST